MNPELRRYLWIEFSAHRAALMPIVIALAVWLVQLVGGGADGVADLSLWAYGALGLVWGTRLASESVVSEIGGRTWDGQRMSAIGPWAMCWAKLLGSPVYAWYGCALLAATFLGATFVDGASIARAFERLALTTGSLVIAHAVSLLASLYAVRRRAGEAPARGAGLFGLGLLAAAPFLLWGGSTRASTPDLVWYGASWEPLPFAIVSTVAFAAWSVVGLYMVMRLELQRRNSPLVWLAFVAFFASWCSGFVEGEASPLGSLGLQPWPDVTYRLLAALASCTALYYLTLIVEPKDPVELRRLLREAGARRWRTAAEAVPRWAVTLAVVVVLGFAVVLSIGGAGVGVHGAVGLVLSGTGFMVRDAAMFVALNLSPRPRRADAAGFVYLSLLYGLAPAILLALDLDALQGMLLPSVEHGVAGAVPALVQGAAMTALAVSRWRRHRAHALGGASAARGPTG